MGLIPSWFSGKGGGNNPPGQSLGAVWRGDEWDFDRPLIHWSQSDVFTLRQAYEAVGIFGELGAAKTTGSGAELALRYLSIGMGLLCNSVKPGDAALLKSYLEQLGLTQNLAVIEPGRDGEQPKWRCNLLWYALKSAPSRGSRVEQVVSMLMRIVEAAERGEKSGGVNDKFWIRSVRQLLRNTVEICLAARGTATMKLIHDSIMSAPQTREQVYDKDWQERSTLYKLIEEADTEDKKAARSYREQSDFELAARYFLTEFAAMPNDTRGSIIASYSVLADVLLRGDMADIFDSDTNIIPEFTFQGVIICLNFPTNKYGAAGLYVQAAFTHLWQLAVQCRDLDRYPRPVAWFCDEAQELINEDTHRFLATARSQKAACILITQNISAYFAALGGEAGRHQVEALTGSMGTKIFHANGHYGTNKWASDMIAEEVQVRGSWHGTMQHPDRHNPGGSENIGHKVLPAEFTTLKKGGAQNGFMTEAIVFQTGASFACNGGQPFLRTIFRQHIPGMQWTRTEK